METVNENTVTTTTDTKTGDTTFALSQQMKDILASLPKLVDPKYALVEQMRDTAATLPSALRAMHNPFALLADQELALRFAYTQGHILGKYLESYYSELYAFEEALKAKKLP